MEIKKAMIKEADSANSKHPFKVTIYLNLFANVCSE